MADVGAPAPQRVAVVAAAYDAYASKPPLNVMTPESLHAYVDYGLRDRGDGMFELKCRPEVEAQVYAMGPNHGAFGAPARTSRRRCASSAARRAPTSRRRSAPGSRTGSRTARSR